MNSRTIVKHQFVDAIPARLDDGIVYVSLSYATAVHKCCCGCGLEVVTPLTPTDWKMIFDGETISLYPSIGNWGFPCRSHYFIMRGRVSWAGELTDKAIEAGRLHDRWAKDRYYSKTGTVAVSIDPPTAPAPPPNADRRFWSWLSRLWR